MLNALLRTVSLCRGQLARALLVKEDPGRQSAV